MNYVYDIYLNFNNELYDFFEWNKNDKLTYVKSIPIIKTTEDNIRKLISNVVELTDITFKKIFDKNKNKKNYVLFCDKNNIIALEFDSNKKVIKKSYLPVSDELEILESIHKYKEINFEFKILSKKKQILKTRKEKIDEQFIKKELSNISKDKLQYVFFECFDYYEYDDNLILKKLLNLSKNSKTYNNLYNILKITSTTQK